MADYYKHFKGGKYKLLGIAKDSETLEKMVVYKALYGEGEMWVRPYDMFFGTVERDGKVMPRFTKIPDEEALGNEIMLLATMNKISNRPDPNAVFPNPNLPRLCFIKNVVKNPRIIIGDYTYYDDVDGADQFEKHVTHFYDFIGDKLIIGKFCAIAKGIEFVMNGANHRMDGVSTYPFYIMGGDWGSAIAPVKDELPLKGDTIVGNDVWIGQNVTVMPGVRIGDGAIIGANSVVASDIPPYAVAAGNPCRVIKKRFDDDFIAYLLELKWWDWDIEKIEANFEALSSGDLTHIKQIGV